MSPRERTRAKARFWLFFLPFVIAGVAGMAGVESAEGPPSAAEALQKLVDGNGRFTNRTAPPRDFLSEFGEFRGKAAAPTIVVACSDMSMPVEVLFDQPVRSVFVVRVSGPVLDTVALGSIEQAATALGSRLLVILGHDGCDAVSASVSRAGGAEGNVASLFHGIAPAVARTKDRSEGASDLDLAVAANVAHQKERALARSKFLRDLTERGALTVVGAILRLPSARVEFPSELR